MLQLFIAKSHSQRDHGVQLSIDICTDTFVCLQSKFIFIRIESEYTDK